MCVCAGDLSALKEKSFTLQEGVKYRIKINFKVRPINTLHFCRMESFTEQITSLVTKSRINSPDDTWCLLTSQDETPDDSDSPVY